MSMKSAVALLLAAAAPLLVSAEFLPLAGYDTTYEIVTEGEGEPLVTKGAKVRVHMLPTRDMAGLLEKRRGDPHHAFWSNLNEGYALFETTNELPAVSIDDGGQYRFAKAKR